MRQEMMSYIRKIILTKATLLIALCEIFGQVPKLQNTEVLAVTARPAHDSITLRWAPINFEVWQLGNSHGYRIERYVIARNGRLLQEQEKLMITTSIKPFSEDLWKSMVSHDRYAAIAAQALFGERFEIDLNQSDVFTIVNKVRENEQRFAFALFSADMSPDVARASGLWFADRHVNKGEKYLYRIVINSIDSLRGSIFIGPDDDYALPKPQNFKAEFKDQLVSLRWDKTSEIHYTAFLVERSEDGKKFTSISDAPLVTVSPTDTEDTRYAYAIDSLKDLSKIFYYRVKGLTPFGEESPPSDVVSGKGLPAVTQVPYISSVESIENTSLHVHWDFPQDNNHAIKGFRVERSFDPTGNFISLTKGLLSQQTRDYEDKIPGPVNYYRVTAHGLDDEPYLSHVYFARLIDSIPPAPPVGLKAKINDKGMVTLSWKPNDEPDMYGYRIYKANHKSEELAQITSEPVAASTFTDHVDLNTLNENIFYSIMSIDKNQNHSGLSEWLKVRLPDKTKPQAPVLLPVKNNHQGVALKWIQSSSEDVIHYTVYRKISEKPEWERLSIINAGTDTIYYYTDEKVSSNETRHYTVLAIDDAGLESDPAHPVSGRKIDDGLRPAIVWRKPVVNREENQVTLRWIYDEGRIASYKLYHSINKQPPLLYKTLSPEMKEVTDTLIPGKHYTYRIMAVFEDGSKSFFSEELPLQY